MKPYPEYKPTGLNWLPQVPSGWKVERGKRLFRVVNERSNGGTEKLLSVSEHYGVIERSKADVTMFMAESYDGYKLCWPDDLVINSLWAWSYGMGFSHDHGIISTAYSVYRLHDTKKFLPEYYNYFVRGTDFHWEMRVRSKGLWKSRYQLSDDSFLSAPFLIPPPAEQRAIVSYLDRETAKIDRLVQLKERMVELLQEKRGAIISSVVTGKVEVGEESKSRVEVEGGVSATLTQRTQRAQSDAKSVGADVLGRPQGFEADRINRIYRIENEANAKIPLRSFANSAFSASAPAGSQNPVNPVNPVQFTTRARRPDELTDSGVDWLGPVPKGWKIAPLRRYCSSTLGKMLQNESQSPEDSYESYLCAKDVHFTGVDVSDLKKMWFSPKEKEQYRVHKGDLLIVEGGAGAGGSAVMPEDLDVYVQNSVHIVRPISNDIETRFVWFWLFSLVKRNYIAQVSNKATIPHFTKELVLSVPLPVPPLPEQRAIVAYLDAVTAKIDAAVKAIEKSIGLLKERRVRLVSDAVTGRIDLRREVAA